MDRKGMSQTTHRACSCEHPAHSPGKMLSTSGQSKGRKALSAQDEKRSIQRVTLHYLLLLHVLCYVSTSQGQIFSKISIARLTLHHLHTQMVAGGQGAACLSGKGTPAHGTGAPCVKGSLLKKKMKAKAFFLIFFFPNGCLRM